MAFAGHSGQDGDQSFRLEGANIIEGFRRQGYCTIGSGAVDWFNTASETGSVLAQPFEHFHFAGNTWSLGEQLHWIEKRLAEFLTISRALFSSMWAKLMCPIGMREPLGTVGLVPAYLLDPHTAAQ